MNKKILVITVLLLTFTLLSIPVMGAPATKKDVTMTAAVAIIPQSGFGVNDNIWHNRGIAVGAVTLNIDGEAPLPGTWNGEWISMSKWDNPPAGDPDATNVVTGWSVLTFPGGTFEGTGHIKTVGLPPPPLSPDFTSSWEAHMVLRGTDAFQGQTLKLYLDYSGGPPLPIPPLVYEGYIIMPK